MLKTLKTSIISEWIFNVTCFSFPFINSQSLYNRAAETLMCTSMFSHLDECDFTLANITVDVLDGHLSVVFYPPLAAENVVDAGCYFVPFIVVPKAVKTNKSCNPLYSSHACAHAKCGVNRGFFLGVCQTSAQFIIKFNQTKIKHVKTTCSFKERC